MIKPFLLFFICIILITGLAASFRKTNVSLSSHFNGDTTKPSWIKDYKGEKVVTANENIIFSTAFDNDLYQPDSSGKTVSLYLETKVIKSLIATGKRIPLNISLVIDRSGSMQGIKLGFAKKAAKEIVNQLTEVDYASIVIYDQAVDTIQPPVLVRNKQLICSKIDAITPRGSTNLWGGTEKGYEFVQRNFKEGFINRVLLISDGLANVGLTDSTIIKLKVQQYKDEKGISISTFGVGLDYNEKLMTDMAETGSGNYYFIDDPHKTAEFFLKELNGLMNVSVQNVKLKIKFSNELKLKKVYPFQAKDSDQSIELSFRDLLPGETKSVLVTFSLGKKPKLPFKIISSLTYTDVLTGLTKIISNENVLTPAKNMEMYLTHYNKEALKQTILYTANENLEKAMSEVDKGNIAAAKLSLDRNTAYLRSNLYYVDESVDLKKWILSTGITACSLNLK